MVDRSDEPELRGVVQVRRLMNGEAGRLREIRLRALRDAPYAFHSQFEREVTHGPEFWEARVAQSDTGQDGVVFVAVKDGRCLGMAGGYFADQEREVTLWGVWVDPSGRGCGLGRRLVEAVTAWARDGDARRVKLSVTDTEPSRPAAALYRGLGFLATGERENLQSDQSLVAIVMSRAL